MQTGDSVPASDLGSLTFTPAQDGNGTGYANFTFRVSDGTDESALAYTMTIDVTAANDAPTSEDKTVSTEEDVAYTFSSADFAFSDVDGDALDGVTVVTVPSLGELALSGAAVQTGDSVPASELGSLTFTPAQDGNGTGYANFTFRVSDGTDESALAYTITIDVTAANDAPTSEDKTVTTEEDVAYTFSSADFAFSDVDGGALVSVRIVALPLAGELELSAVAVIAGQVVLASELGSLTFTPAQDGNGTGYANFTFRVSDGTDESTQAYTMTIDVTAVNDAPTSEDKTVTTEEDVAYTFSSADFAFSDVDGGAVASVRIVALPLAGELELSAAAVIAGQVVLASELGSLTFTPAAGRQRHGLRELHLPG